MILQPQARDISDDHGQKNGRKLQPNFYFFLLMKGIKNDFLPEAMNCLSPRTFKTTTTVHFYYCRQLNEFTRIIDK